MAYSCPLHNWYSFETWCPACHPVSIISASTQSILSKGEGKEDDKWIKVKVEYLDHEKIKLSRLNGDTFTSTSTQLNEELGDFLHTPDPTSQPSGVSAEGVRWEIFQDESYFGLWAVRPVGDKDFNSSKLFHLPSENEALRLQKYFEYASSLLTQRDDEIKKITENRDHLRTLLIEAQDTAKEWLEKYEELLSQQQNRD